MPPGQIVATCDVEGGKRKEGEAEANEETGSSQWEILQRENRGFKAVYVYMYTYTGKSSV